MNDQKRPVDRAAQRVAIVEDARVEVGPDSVGEVVADLALRPTTRTRQLLVARQRLGNPAAEDPVAAQDGDHSRRVSHSGSTHPS